jgi:hypothetical protein
MPTPNVYVPYPYPQSLEEVQADLNAIIYQPEVPQELQDQWKNVQMNPEVQADVDQAEANSDSMANE